jgi:hypothetical protein
MSKDISEIFSRVHRKQKENHMFDEPKDLPEPKRNRITGVTMFAAVVLGVVIIAIMLFPQ